MREDQGRNETGGAGPHETGGPGPHETRGVARVVSPDELPAFRAGDHTLFRRLVDAYSPRLLATALSYLRDSDQAHDAVQDVWLRAYERRRQLECAGSLLGWLMSICRKTCLSEHRRGEVRGQDLSHVPGATPTATAPADRTVEALELQRAVAEAIVELGPRQRDVVALRILEGRSTREAAVLLGCAEGTVKASLHQALKKLNPLLRSWRHVVVS